MKRRSSSISAGLCLLPFFLVFTLFQILPLGWVFLNSFKGDLGEVWSLENYEYILSSRFYAQTVFNSLKVSLYCSLLGMLIAIPSAWSLHRIEGRLKKGVLAFSNMIANFSGVPLAFAFIILLGVNGSLTLLLQTMGMIESLNLYNSKGLILIYTYFQIPLALLLIFPAFEGMKDEWQEAADLLGAGRARYWLHVGWPVLMPCILGTFIILFANAMGTMATAYALTGGSYNLLTIQINNLVAGDIFLDPWMASALAMLLVSLLVIVTLANEWLMKSRRSNAVS